MARITKIEATRTILKRKIRVAAYARVSTDSDEQLLSLETQKAHYEEYIKSCPDYEFAGLYYDEGISGTKITKRDELQRLLKDCEDGKIDRVITKSISRFARNTTDCLEMVRRLSQLKISIYFEKENIDTDHMSSELMLSILSSIAESESRSISENSKWSVKRRFENGTFIISCPPYGYENKDGKMVVVPEEAEVVKDIFRMSLSGMGCHRIAKVLNDRGFKTKRNGIWHASSVEGILKNEKYTGDVILQKTFTDESFNRHVNYGEEDMYLHKNHHEAIISYEDFDKATEAMRQRKSEKGIVDENEKYLYIEPEIYYQEKHDLDVEIVGLAKEKDQISGSLKGGLKHLEEAGKLMKAVSKEAPVEFDGKLFEAVVESATIISREKICFNLKCGLQLEERLVKA